MEKRWLLIFAAFVMFAGIFSVSAEMSFSQQPDDVYNFGDKMSVSVTEVATQDLDGKLYTYIICNGMIKELGNVPVALGAGEIDTFDFNFFFKKEYVGISGGTCKIKSVVLSSSSVVLDDPIFTNEFEVSNSIVVQSKIDQIEFNPGETLVFEGEATKKNGDGANGFVEFEIVAGNDTSFQQTAAVANGYFSISADLPEDMAAGAYLVKVNVYELNSEGDKINSGFMNYNIAINQVPTSLEIVLENSGVEPGTNLKAKTVLHDQTGESISASSIITVKKSKTDIVQQMEEPTGEYLELAIPYNEPPANWSVYAVSSMLSAEVQVTIAEKSEISVDIVNGTIVMTNLGNVIYNDTVFVKIGDNSSVDIPVYLNVDESKEYSLNAPDGEYYVEVISNGESKFQSEGVFLTGKVIDFKEKGGSFGSNALVWIFIIVILGVVAFLVYKKGYKKSFFGRKSIGNISEHKKISPKVVSKNDLIKGSVMEAGARAKLSLSIKGEKHPATFVCLKIKNWGEIKKESIAETMNRISSLAERKKAFIYENQENIFFILASVKTKTFQNEKAAIEIAKNLEELLTGHNRLFKAKMDFGISITEGEIVSKINDSGELEFMGMGNIITISKKIANLSGGEIFLSKEFKEKSGGMIKAEDRTVDGTKVYTIREMRDREQHKEFISNFLHGLERDKKDKERREKKE